MNALAIKKGRQNTWGRRVLSAFAAAWLALAMQPCAMAAEVDDSDCPHCPPSETPPCEVKLSPDCGPGDQIAGEVRGKPVKLKDVPNDVPVAIVPATFEPARYGHRPPPVLREYLLFNPSGPPRNVLFCVYLK